ncbi:hypothetical protein ACB094_01G308300 [Castanea mollissima]
MHDLHPIRIPKKPNATSHTNHLRVNSAIKEQTVSNLLSSVSPNTGFHDYHNSRIIIPNKPPNMTLKIGLQSALIVPYYNIHGKTDEKGVGHLSKGCNSSVPLLNCHPILAIISIIFPFSEHRVCNLHILCHSSFGTSSSDRSRLLGFSINPQAGPWLEENPALRCLPSPERQDSEPASASFLILSSPRRIALLFPRISPLSCRQE